MLCSFERLTCEMCVFFFVFRITRVWVPTHLRTSSCSASGFSLSTVCWTSRLMETSRSRRWRTPGETHVRLFISMTNGFHLYRHSVCIQIYSSNNNKRNEWNENNRIWIWEENSSKIFHPKINRQKYILQKENQAFKNYILIYFLQYMRLCKWHN